MELRFITTSVYISLYNYHNNFKDFILKATFLSYISIYRPVGNIPVEVYNTEK